MFSFMSAIKTALLRQTEKGGGLLANLVYRSASGESTKNRGIGEPFLRRRELVCTSAHQLFKTKKGQDRSPALLFTFQNGYLPVPDSATLCGLPGALSVKLRLPVRVPVCVGVKFTLTMQLLPAASVLPHFLADVNENNAKSPVVAMFEMFKTEAPVLVTVTFFAGEVTPTFFVGKAIEVGLRLTIGPLAEMVSEMVVDAVREPEVPPMVIVDVPAAVPEATVRVSVLVVLVGFGLKPAVTPLGRPVAFSVTLPLKPPAGTTVIVLVPWAPDAIVSEFGLAVRLKDGPAGWVRALMRAAPFGLPHPVARSYPVVAGSPLLPLVMSWKSVV